MKIKSLIQRIVVLTFVALLCSACSAGQSQRKFATPEEAVQGLDSALKSKQKSELISLFGKDSEGLLNSGDAVDDKLARERFVVAFNEAHAVEMQGDDVAILDVGTGRWPFPIPLVKDGGKWFFDTEQGKDELLMRRIGQNELDAIRLSNFYVEAQNLYAAQKQRASGTSEYATRFISQDGARDGLYWTPAAGETQSPLGPLVAEAIADGYQRNIKGPNPYHGYLYRILTAQGPAAPGGAKSYLASDGRMTGGFALVASPIEWRESGVMTFVVNQDGKIYEKDLGAETAEAFTSMQAFNPDDTWTVVTQ